MFTCKTEKRFLQRHSKPSRISFGLKYFASGGEISLYLSKHLFKKKTIQWLKKSQSKDKLLERNNVFHLSHGVKIIRRSKPHL